MRTVVLFLTGQTISLFGSSLVQYAVMWYLTLQTKSGTVMMAYALFAFLPQGILSLVGGTLADRVSRKALIIVSDGAIALTTLALALVMTMGHTDLWLIYAAVCVRSIGAGFQQPAVGALLPQITPTAHLMRVNSVNTTIQSALALVAPAAARITDPELSCAAWLRTGAHRKSEHSATVAERIRAFCAANPKMKAIDAEMTMTGD